MDSNIFDMNHKQLYQPMVLDRCWIGPRDVTSNEPTEQIRRCEDPTDESSSKAVDERVQDVCHISEIFDA